MNQAVLDMTTDNQDAIQGPYPAFGQEGELVTKVTHWTKDLFSFRLARPQSFRFRSGEFVMLGIKDENDKPILRAYSIASPNWDDELEFYSIIAEGGALTQRLKHIQVGQRVILKPKSTGTLILDALNPGKRLIMFSTGTGIAPFASLIRDPETYQRFESVILAHGCRYEIDHSYGKAIAKTTLSDPLIGEEAQKQLTHYPVTTREESPYMGRLTDLLDSGKIWQDLKIDGLNRETDRVMLCGSMDFNLDMKARLEKAGFAEGAVSDPGDFVLEKAFVG